ncbi:hypothetical protein BG74_04985, partial [Sodalis-like endosymbiont of Proechinophthirus fluctus]
MHQHGLDAVFSVLYSICTLEQEKDNAEENVRAGECARGGAQYRRHGESWTKATLKARATFRA